MVLREWRNRCPQRQSSWIKDRFVWAECTQMHAISIQLRNETKSAAISFHPRFISPPPHQRPDFIHHRPPQSVAFVSFYSFTNFWFYRFRIIFQLLGKCVRVRAFICCYTMGRLELDDGSAEIDCVSGKLIFNSFHLKALPAMRIRNVHKHVCRTVH